MSQDYRVASQMPKNDNSLDIFTAMQCYKHKQRWDGYYI